VYASIIYFITVILIYTTYIPSAQQGVAGQRDLAGIVVVSLIFFLYNRLIFKRFETHGGRSAPLSEAFATRHAALVQRSTILAICIYATWVYVFDLKVLLMAIPFTARSIFLNNIVGIMPFVFLLLIVWLCAAPSYQKHCRPAASTASYISSHVKISAAVVLPWLLVSLILDALAFAAADFYQAISSNPLAGIVFFAALLGTVALFFPVVLIKLWDCIPVPPGALRSRLEDFCRRHHFRYRDIVVWNLFDGRLVTAGVIGFIRQFRYVLISPVLLQILDEQELEAVIAHEIGHVKNHHMVYYVFFLLGYVVVAYGVLELVTYKLLSQDFFVAFIVAQFTDITAPVSALLTIIPLAFFIIYFRLFFGYVSRHFERQSDLYALELTGSGAGLTGSLEKIALVSAQNRNARNWHHFGIAERVAFIQRCEAHPALIQSHNRHVARIRAFAVIALILCGALLYGADGQRLSRAHMTFSRKILEQQIARQPDNFQYYFMLGNLYYETGDFAAAEIQFKKALALNPDDPEALNNLAWLYATAPVEELRKPADALRLAEKAARISPLPHILDTLGESYFVNGRYAEAVQALEAALAAGADNTGYYLAQLEKFRRYRDGRRV